MKLSFLQSIIKNNVGALSNGSIQPGQTIKGKVLKLYPNHLALLQIGSKQMVAELKAPLELGLVYAFRVISTTPKLELKMMKTIPKQPMKEIGKEIFDTTFTDTDQSNRSGEVQFQLSHDGPLQSAIMQIPFETRDILVKWQGHEKDGHLDPDYCRMTFYFELEFLKETAIEIQIQNRIMNLTIWNDHPVIEKLLSKLQPILKENLASANYTLSSIKVQKAAEIPIGKQEALHPSKYNGVDIRI